MTEKCFIIFFTATYISKPKNEIYSLKSIVFNNRFMNFAICSKEYNFLEPNFAKD